MSDKEDHITLKWGTLKSWSLNTENGRKLLEEYFSFGSCGSAMHQQDTPRQKELICQMIDECRAPTIWMDWDGLEVSKEEAKRYVMEYGNAPPPSHSSSLV